MGEHWFFTGGRWSLLNVSPLHRANACSVVIDNELWVCGGNTGTCFDDQKWVCTKTVEVYSIATNSWYNQTSLNVGRDNAVCGVVAGLLVVAGGSCDRFGEFRRRLQATDTVEVYDPAIGKWIVSAPLPHATFSATACVLNERLFVAGGHCSGHNSNKLQIWDGKKWTLGASMPDARCAAASVVHDGKMMVIGGYVHSDEDQEATRSVIVYDPKTDTWTDYKSLPYPRSYCRAMQNDGAIILVGDGKPMILKEGKWSFMHSCPKHLVWGKTYDDITTHSMSAGILVV